MSDDSKKVWLGVGTWLLQRSFIVAVVAAGLWVQVHFVSKPDFDFYKTDQLRQQAELNKTLYGIAMSLKEITDNHTHDSKELDDHEDRIRKLQEDGKHK